MYATRTYFYAGCCLHYATANGACRGARIRLRFDGNTKLIRYVPYKEKPCVHSESSTLRFKIGFDVTF